MLPRVAVAAPNGDPRHARALRLRVGRRGRAPVASAPRTTQPRSRGCAPRGHVYECACTRRELETAPFGASGERVYPGTCRDGIPAGSRSANAARVARARRRRANRRSAIGCRARRRRISPRDVGDFVVRRADGLYAYQLAVVVDDALQRHHARRARRRPPGVDAAPDPPAAAARLSGRRRICTCRSRSTRSGEKLSKQTRAAPLPDDALPALLRRVALPRPAAARADRERRRRRASSGRGRSRAWQPRRLPPVRDASGADRASRARRAGKV